MAASAAAPVGTLEYLVVRGDFAGKPLPAGVNPASIHALYHTNTRNVEHYYDEVSYGQLVVDTLIDPTGGKLNLGIAPTCDHILIRDVVIDQLESAGVPLSNYYGLVIFMDWSGQGCPFANRATVGQVEVKPGLDLAVSWMGSFHLQEFPNFHEIGHTLGAGHATFWACPDVTGPGPDCNCEYGDTLDVMGSSETCVGSSSTTGHWNAPHKHQVGTWFDPVVNFAELGPGQGGIHLLFPIELSTGSHLQALKIPRGFGDALWVEFRRPLGLYDTAGLLESAGIVGGAAVLHFETQPGRTAVIDPHPGFEGYPNQNRLALRIGDTFYDPCSDVTLSVPGFVPKPPRLMIDVTFGGGCNDFDNPTVSIINPAPGTALVGTVTLRAMADDASSPIDRVEFWSGDTLIGTATQPVAGNPSIFEVLWDTSGVPNGPTTLFAIAYDDPVGCCPASTRSLPVNVLIGSFVPATPMGNR